MTTTVQAKLLVSYEAYFYSSVINGSVIPCAGANSQRLMQKKLEQLMWPDDADYTCFSRIENLAYDGRRFDGPQIPESDYVFMGKEIQASDLGGREPVFLKSSLNPRTPVDRYVLCRSGRIYQLADGDRIVAPALTTLQQRYVDELERVNGVYADMDKIGFLIVADDEAWQEWMTILGRVRDSFGRTFVNKIEAVAGYCQVTLQRTQVTASDIRHATDQWDMDEGRLGTHVWETLQKLWIHRDILKDKKFHQD